MAGFSSYIDKDVAMDILSRLPVKSLLRLRCVCKSWYSLIESPYFVTKHLQQRNLIHNNNNSSPLFVIRPNTPISWISSSSNGEATLDDDDEVPLINLDSLPFSDEEVFPIVLGPVNGIYCAVSRSRLGATIGKDNKIFLWNPALRDFKAIPDVPYHHPMIEEEEEDFFDAQNTHGFGYDSKRNDFKVVAITRRSCKPAQSTCVFVYALGSNSWRKIDSGRNFAALPGVRPAVFMSHGNGVLHWLATDDPKRPEVTVILSFNLGTEVFRELPLPDAIMAFRRKTYLVVFNDSIGIVVRHNTHHEIWVMKEYGVEDSWTKLCIIGPPLDIRPLPFSKNGGHGYEETKLVSYDNPSIQKIKNLISGHPLQVVTYMESLVSINGSYWPSKRKINGGY